MILQLLDELNIQNIQVPSFYNMQPMFGAKENSIYYTVDYMIFGPTGQISQITQISNQMSHHGEVCTCSHSSVVANGSVGFLLSQDFHFRVVLVNLEGFLSTGTLFSIYPLLPLKGREL